MGRIDRLSAFGAVVKIYYGQDYDLYAPTVVGLRDVVARDTDPATRRQFVRDAARLRSRTTTDRDIAEFADRAGMEMDPLWSGEYASWSDWLTDLERTIERSLEGGTEGDELR